MASDELPFRLVILIAGTSFVWAAFIAYLIFSNAPNPGNKVSPNQIKRIYEYCLTFEDASDCESIKDFYNRLVMLE